MHPSDRSSKFASATKRTCSSWLRRTRPSGCVIANRVKALASSGCLRRRVQAGEVDVERGLAVQRVHAVVGALRDHHRLADAPPAVTDADSQRTIRGDGRQPTTLFVSTSEPCKLCGRGHLEVVAGTAAHERDPRSGDGVRAADDLLLVARQSIREEEQHPVLALLNLREARRNGSAAFAQPVSLKRSCRRGDGEAFAAERGDHDAEVGRSGRGDLTCRRAANQGRAARGFVDPREQLLQVVRIRAEDEQERCRTPCDGKRRRLDAGGVRVRVRRLTDGHPSLCVHSAAPSVDAHVHRAIGWRKVELRPATSGRDVSTSPSSDSRRRRRASSRSRSSRRPTGDTRTRRRRRRRRCGGAAARARRTSSPCR